MIDSDFYEKTLMTGLSAGLPMISVDTSAQICAVILDYGNNEAYTLSRKLNADLKYITRRFHIQGGEVPSVEFVRSLQHYHKKLEQHEKQHKAGFPLWAESLFKDRYGITLKK